MTTERVAAHSGRAKIFGATLFAAAALAAYSGVLPSYFLSDDFGQIGRVLAGDLSVTWGRDHGGFFRPLFVLSLLVDAKLWGRAPLGYHLTSVLLHALNACLVSLLALRLAPRAGIGGGAARRFALAAGLIFLVHPSHTEAVTWISGRADLLATCFCLLALLASERDDAAGPLAPGRQPAARPLYARLAAPLLFALALLSKEAAAGLPVIVFLLALGRSPRRGARAAHPLREAAPFAAVLAVFAAVRAAALGTFLGGYGAGHHLNFTHSMIVSQLLRCPLRALLPAVALRSFPFLESRALSPTLIVLGCVLVVALAVALSRAGGRRALASFVGRNRFAWLLAALFLAALLPAINLRVDVFTTQGERFLYLPTVFSSALLARVLLGGANSSRRRRARTALLCALLALYAFSLRAANEDWREAARLSRAVVEGVAARAGRDSVLLLNLPDSLRGTHLFRNGLPEALRTFQDARPIRSAHVLTWHGLASAGDAAQLSSAGGDDYTLRLPGGVTSFERFNERAGFAEILERSPTHIRLRLVGEGRACDVFYFSVGGVVKLE